MVITVKISVGRTPTTISLAIVVMDDIGTYQERKFPAFRNPTIDVLEHGRKKHHIPLLLEIDITEARGYLRQIKAESGQSLSFTAWVMACVGRAVGEHKHVHALRKGRRRLVLFDDVDISVLVERAVGDGNGRAVPGVAPGDKADAQAVSVCAAGQAVFKIIYHGDAHQQSKIIHVAVFRAAAGAGCSTNRDVRARVGATRAGLVERARSERAEAHQRDAGSVELEHRAMLEPRPQAV